MLLSDRRVTKIQQAARAAGLSKPKVGSRPTHSVWKKTSDIFVVPFFDRNDAPIREDNETRTS